MCKYHINNGKIYVLPYKNYDLKYLSKERIEMSKLSKWAERCYVDGTEVHCLEQLSNTTGLFMTKKKIGNGIPCYSWTSPVYHIWINDKELFTCMNYLDAYEIYKNEKEYIEND